MTPIRRGGIAAGGLVMRGGRGGGGEDMIGGGRGCAELVRRRGGHSNGQRGSHNNCGRRSCWPCLQQSAVTSRNPTSSSSSICRLGSRSRVRMAVAVGPRSNSSRAPELLFKNKKPKPKKRRDNGLTLNDCIVSAISINSSNTQYMWALRVERKRKTKRAKIKWQTKERKKQNL